MNPAPCCYGSHQRIPNGELVTTIMGRTVLVPDLFGEDSPTTNNQREGKEP